MIFTAMSKQGKAEDNGDSFELWLKNNVNEEKIYVLKSEYCKCFSICSKDKEDFRWK